jgi:hypothetical protein
MRSTFLSIIGLSAGLLCGADAGTAFAASSNKLQCESRSPGGDLRDISCALDVASAPQGFRFKADFSGGHDDTTASMTLSVDGAPLPCEQGSKTHLMGEDGDVSLECRFSLPDSGNTSRVLRVLLKWNHAQYTDFALTRIE